MVDSGFNIKGESSNTQGQKEGGPSLKKRKSESTRFQHSRPSPAMLWRVDEGGNPGQLGGQAFYDQGIVHALRKP